MANVCGLRSSLAPSVHHWTLRPTPQSSHYHWLHCRHCHRFHIDLQVIGDREEVGTVLIRAICAIGWSRLVFHLHQVFRLASVIGSAADKMSANKNKRFNKFIDNWILKKDCKDWLSKKDDHSAHCKLCNRDITVKYMGFKAINDHKNSKLHQDNMKARIISQSMSTFVRTVKDKELDEVIVSELCLTYHTIKHTLSYRSADCGIKLITNLFKDSKICKNLNCGRTKMEAFAQNILCPLSIKNHLKNIENRRFSISTDASNRGNTKMFPIAIQYFNCEIGINNFIIDFINDQNETSENIYNFLVKTLSENKLSVMKLSAFTGDNASVNYGVNNSVFVNLKNENPHIVKANCNCHVIHNTAKYSMLKLPFDIENLVLKIYSHFCISAKRVEQLKSCYEFVDSEFEVMKRHVVTRWLSLYPAITRIINNIEPLKSYFIGLGN